MTVDLGNTEEFKALTAEFKSLQTVIVSLGNKMRESQIAVASHFQTSSMKELYIFRTLEQQIRSNTLTTELMQEALTALNILRTESMTAMSVILENALHSFREEFTTDKTE